MSPPVKPGDVVKLSICGFGTTGDPMMKSKKYILFLKDYKDKSLPLNTLIDVKVTKVLKDYGFVKLNKKKEVKKCNKEKNQE